jgi:hypothetical protein
LRVIEGVVVSVCPLHAFLKHSSIQEASVDATYSHQELSSFMHLLNLLRSLGIYPDKDETAVWGNSKHETAVWGVWGSSKGSSGRVLKKAFGFF